MKRHRRSAGNRIISEMKSRLLPFSTMTFIGLTGALCLWATIPYGSVTPWAQAVVVVGALFIGLLGWFLKEDSPLAPVETAAHRPWFLLFSACLCLWILIQILPLPVKLLRFLQPLSWGSYSLLFDGSAWTQIACERYLVQMSAVLWFAYGMIGWSCSRCLCKRRSVLSMGYIIVVIGAMQAAAGIFLRSPELWAGNPFLGRRLCGTFSSGNSFGGFLAMTTLVSVGVLMASIPKLVDRVETQSVKILLLSKTNRLHGIAIISILAAVVIQYVALIMSGSRGAIVSGFVAVVVLLGWYFRRMKRDGRNALLPLLLLCLLGVVIMGIGGVYAAVGSRFSVLFGDSGVATVPRLSIWIETVKLIVSRPMGVGPGCFGEAFSMFQPHGFQASRVLRAHNDYLHLISELGFAGILPLAGMVYLCCKLARRVVIVSSDDYTVWVWRGMLMGIVAALLHAFVDFNLTSRPGVALLFFVLLGIVCGFDPQRLVVRKKKTNAFVLSPRVMSLKQTAGRSAAESQPAIRTASALPRLLLVTRRIYPSIQRLYDRLMVLPVGYRFVALALVSLTMMVSAINYGRSSWLIEEAASALGLEFDSYYWIHPDYRQPAMAVDMFQKAIAVAPGSSRTYEFMGRGIMREFEEKRQNLADDMVKGGQIMDEAAAIFAAEIALRDEELVAARDALEYYRKAVKLAPWDVAVRSRASLAAAAVTAFGVDENDGAQWRSGLNDALCSAHLGQNIAIISARICQSLSLLLNSPWMDDEGRSLALLKIKEWGRNALTLYGDVDKTILSSWYLAEVDMIEMLEDTAIPLNVIWQAYALYDGQSKPEESFAALSLMERDLKDEKRPIARLWNKTAEQQRLEFKVSHGRELSKWLLRTRQWERYRLLEDLRAELFEQALQGELISVYKDSASKPLKYLKLRSLYDNWGLNVSNLMQLAQFELDQGHAARGTMLVNTVFTSEEAGFADQLRLFLDGDPDIDEVSRRSLRIRLAMEDEDYKLAFAGLRELRKSGDVSSSLMHRIEYLMAVCSVQEKDDARARAHLANAVKYCGSDPDVLRMMMEQEMYAVCGFDELGNERRAVELLNAVTPSYRLGMSFLGGRAELLGFDLVDKSVSSYSDLDLQVFWRFHGSLPSDLECIIYTSDSQGVAAFIQRIPFNMQNTRVFSAGRMQPGTVMKLNVAMPVQAMQGERLRIGLQRRSEWMYSQERLPYAEVWGWDSLIRKPILIVHDPRFVSVKTENIDKQTAQELSGLFAASVFAARAAEQPTASTTRSVMEIIRRDRDSDNDFDLKLLGEEGYSIVARSNVVTISSAYDQGLLNGAAYLLQNVLGYHWYLPDKDWRFMPDPAWSLVEPLKIMEAPAFCKRVFSFDKLVSDDVSAWVRYNAASAAELSGASSENVNLSITDPIGIFASGGLESFADEVKARHEAGAQSINIGLRQVSGPAPWMAARLMWNPWQKVNHLIDDYCDRTFAGSAGFMKEYFKLLRNADKLSSEQDAKSNYARQSRLDSLINDAKRYMDDPLISARIDSVSVAPRTDPE